MFHLIPQAFSDWGARDDETARDLLSIYDALTGSRLYEVLPQPTVDRRRRLHGFQAELSRVLYGALEAGILRFERHEVSWPFPENDEKPAERKPQSEVQERPGTFTARVVDPVGDAVDGIELLFEAQGQQKKVPTDASGVARWTVTASEATVRIANVESVRQKLIDRWTAARKRKTPEGPEVTICELEDDVPPFTVRDAVQHTLLLEPPRMEIPEQKESVVGSDEPILLASNDPNFIPGGGVRAQHEKRGKDTSPANEPPDVYASFRQVDSPSAPDIAFDHGFLDDGNGNIDPAKRRAATAEDKLAKRKWEFILAGAILLRPDLYDGSFAYDHFIHGNGEDWKFDFERYVSSTRNKAVPDVAVDGSGVTTLESIIEDARAGAIEIHDRLSRPTFVMQTDGVTCGDSARYPYPATENWQKSVGGFTIWMEATVTVQMDPAAGTRHFTVDLTVHGADRYNFDPRKKDMGSGTPDAVNGRFEVSGLGHEFMQYGTLKRTISFTVALRHNADPRAKPGDQNVKKPGGRA
ncbi:Ig-like domain-containing protein [Pendulispora brunnea]|uniref:Ig-like domain-containing protein n=1 Tax=Pendulispora brunnea TaxID=2905690 RepID=A0ABZ2KLL8_9BACT